MDMNRRADRPGRKGGWPFRIVVAFERRRRSSRRPISTSKDGAVGRPGAIGLLLALLLVAGCGFGTKFSYDQVRQLKPGMNADEVTAIMGGPPMSMFSQPTMEGAPVETWTYSYAGFMAIGGIRSVTLTFEDGKLVRLPGAIPSTPAK